MDAGHSRKFHRALALDDFGGVDTPTVRASRPVRRCARNVGLHVLALATVVAATTAAAQTGTVPSNVDDAPAAQVRSEVDSFMKRVFENRDTSWRRLGDFVLREVLTLYLEAPTEIPLSGFRREYEWCVRDGVAVRRPVRFTGALIDEDRQQNYEEEWLHEESQRRAGRDGEDPEPRFISDTYYFTEFPFEPGSYYLADREIVAGREVVRIEYYPTDHVDQGFDARINRGFNKTSVVTYWVDPEVHQIVEYTFDSQGLDFLRFRWILRVDGLESSAGMAPVGDIWLPAKVTTTGRVTTAFGAFRVTLTREFVDYRKAETAAWLVDSTGAR